MFKYLLQIQFFYDITNCLYVGASGTRAGVSGGGPDILRPYGRGRAGIHEIKVAQYSLIYLVFNFNKHHTY